MWWFPKSPFWWWFPDGDFRSGFWKWGFWKSPTAKSPFWCFLCGDFQNPHFGGDFQMGISDQDFKNEDFGNHQLQSQYFGALYVVPPFLVLISAPKDSNFKTSNDFQLQNHHFGGLETWTILFLLKLSYCKTLQNKCNIWRWARPQGDGEWTCIETRAPLNNVGLCCCHIKPAQPGHPRGVFVRAMFPQMFSSLFSSCFCLAEGR